MKSQKYIYVGVILLIYIPLVFMGANIFFPNFTGPDSHYRYVECPSKSLDLEPDRDCFNKQENSRLEFEREKSSYNAYKYIFVVVISLISLLIINFINVESIIKLGIFLGAIISTFISTLVHFNTNSKIGFAILVLIFILVIYYINKNKQKLLS